MAIQRSLKNKIFSCHKNNKKPNKIELKLVYLFGSTSREMGLHTLS